MPKASAADENEERADGLTAFESRLVNLVALWLIQGRTQPEQIALLGRAGFRSSEVARLLGTTRNTVSVELSRQKRVGNVLKSKKDRK